MDPVYIGGTGMSRFGPSEQGLLDLMQHAARTALQSDEGGAPEALFVGAMSPEALGHVANLATAAAHALGLNGVPAIRVETASSSGAAVFAVATSAVASGQYQKVLAIAGEKMTGMPTPQVTRVLAEVIDEDERSVGLTMAGMAALIARAFAHHENIGEKRLKELLARLSLKAHANGAFNPIAQFQKPISEDAYWSGRPVADPLSVFDCAPISDGAAAVVLTSRKTGIRVAGMGQGTDTPSVCGRRTLTGFPATTQAAQKAYRMAGFGPKDIDFAEIHDAFTIFELTSMRDLGLFPGKEAEEAIEKELTGLRGAFPINPSGGLKSRGHPVGASGLAQVVEACLQMRGEAGERRQLERAGRALTHSIGGPGSNNFVVLLEKPTAGAVSTPPVGAAPLSQEVHLPKIAKASSSNGAGAPTGRVASFTTLHIPAEGFPGPLTLALVDLTNGGRILAPVPNTTALRIGARVAIDPSAEPPALIVQGRRRPSFGWMRSGASKARRWLTRRPPTTPIGR